MTISHRILEVADSPYAFMLILAIGVQAVPFQYFFLGIFVLLMVTILRSKPSVQELISAANSIGNNPMGVIVLVIGCIMMVESKYAGVDSNIASTIIGYGGGLLQAQVKDQLHPPGSIVNTTQEIKSVTPPAPPIPKE